MWVVFVDVEDEDLACACSACADAYSPVFVGGGEPFGDGGFVAGGDGLPCFDSCRIFFAWCDGDDSDASSGVEECVVEDGHWRVSLGCCGAGCV